MRFHLYCAYVEDGYETNHYFIADRDTANADLQSRAERLVSHPDAPTQWSEIGQVSQDMLDTVHERIETGPFRLTSAGKIESSFSGAWEPVDEAEFSSNFRNAYSSQ